MLHQKERKQLYLFGIQLFPFLIKYPDPVQGSENKRNEKNI